MFSWEIFFHCVLKLVYCNILTKSQKVNSDIVCKQILKYSRCYQELNRINGYVTFTADEGARKLLPRKRSNIRIDRNLKAIIPLCFWKEEQSLFVVLQF